MTESMVLIGVIKIAVAMVLTVFGAALGALLVLRALGISDMGKHLREGNLAVALLFCSSTAAIGVMLNVAAGATFTAIDLLRYDSDELDLVTIILYGSGHLSIALVTGVIVIIVGLKTVMLITRHFDEMDEIQNKNIAAALMLSTFILILAFLVNPGLQTLLDGLLPLPQLGRSISIHSS